MPYLKGRWTIFRRGHPSFGMDLGLGNTYQAGPLIHNQITDGGVLYYRLALGGQGHWRPTDMALGLRTRSWNSEAIWHKSSRVSKSVYHHIFPCSTPPRYFGLPPFSRSSSIPIFKLFSSQILKHLLSPLAGKPGIPRQY